VNLIGPHYALAYMRAFSRWRELEVPAAAAAFSPREEEIMRWVSEGKTNWEISVIMNLSLDTVKYYLKNVMDRLRVETRAAAVARWQWATSNLLKPSDRHSSDSFDGPQ
jgi:DNA-binding CsgD family transcriptional regulator